MSLSTEGFEDWASRVRAWGLSRARARAVMEAAPVGARIDAAALTTGYSTVAAIDRAAGVWLLEAMALASLDSALESYAAAWRRKPIQLANESPISLAGLSSVIEREPNAARRAMVLQTAEERLLDHVAVARSVVDAWRALHDLAKLPSTESSFDRLGWGSAEWAARAAHDVLATTDDMFRETDRWIRERLELPRTGALSWSDRLRTRAMTRTTELLPAGDRSGIASRWISRIGLNHAAASVRDITTASRLDALGVFAIVDAPGERASIIGTPSPAAVGTIDVTAALAEAAISTLAVGPRVSARAGVDRIHGAIARILGRRLFLSPTFLSREASIDPGARERVMLECVHNELFTSRLEAAQSLFAIDVMNRASDLPARFREHLSRALYSAPAPTWAVHQPRDWLFTRPIANGIALVLASQIQRDLRDRYDEDWFRNPRTGEGLTAWFSAMRTDGTATAFANRAGVKDPIEAIEPMAFRRELDDSVS